MIPAALLLLVLCSFFPGFFFLRRLRWTPLEKLCGSVGLSLILLYLGAWGAYTLGPKDQRPVYWAMVAASAVLAALGARDAFRFFATFRIRQTLLAFGGLLAFGFTMLSIIRVYTGGVWAVDWAEHFQRALFFLDRLPTDTRIVYVYALPARPPMQNVLAALFLGLTAERFEIFQVIFAFLNALLFLPCLLLMPALGFRKRRAVIPMVALFAANPALMESFTYTWTKALPAFYVILAIALYLAGWRKSDYRRTTAAFVALAAGILAHYSTGPYVVVLGLHFLWRFFHARPRPWRDLAFAAAPAALLLATWFGWSFHVYGVKTTLTSNTSVSTADKDPVKNTAKILANLVDTIIPSWARDITLNNEQYNSDGRLRDQAFVFYEANIIFAMGSLGGVVVLWLLYRGLIRGVSGREQTFWRVLIPATIVLGVAVVGERDTLGVTHLTLLSVVAIGLTALAGAFGRLNAAVRLALVAACCVDFGLGIFLHARIQSLENTDQDTIYSEVEYLGNGQFRKVSSSPRALSVASETNWEVKHEGEVLARRLFDLPRKYSGDVLFRSNFSGIAQNLRVRLENNRKEWGGWYQRHDGKLEYLGDHVAGPNGTGTDVASVVLVLLFAGGMYLLGRQALAASPVEVPATAAKAKRPSGRKAARR
jgi:hypothetical protein